MTAPFKPHENWKMFIYSAARTKNNACTYYRQLVPMSGLYELGLANGFYDRGDHHVNKEEADKQAMFAFLTADIALLYAVQGDQGEVMANTIRGMKSGMIGDKLIYPPSLVYDFDDNLDWVHPFNNTFSMYGIRGADGKLLEPGQNVGVKLADGREIIHWQDMVTKGDQGFVFNIARNLEWNKRLHHFVTLCDGFTTPSEYLRKYMVSNHGYPEGYVYPNSIIPEDWIQTTFAPRKKNIRILWQGGGSHSSDWFALRGAMKFIAKKYPHVTFVFFGTQFGWITDHLPEEQVEVHEWVPFDAYRPTRVCLDCDINLCVLKDDEFSRSKSAIKWYEGSILKKPEATLAPNMVPYAGEIVDGETGLLYDVSGTPEANAESFAANLSQLIENKELRLKLADAAKKWVLENRHYLKTAPGLYDYYMELRARKAVECPYVPGAPIPPPETPAPKPPKKRVPRSKRGVVRKKK